MSRITAFLLATFLATGMAMAQEKPAPRTITLTAEGEVAARPDMAMISASVVSEARTAGEAFAMQRERATAVVEAIKAAGVEERDIQTSGISIDPRMSQAGERAPRIEGYLARNTITIRLRKVEGAGAVLDSLVEAGVNQIEGMVFDFSNREELLDEARKAAAAELKRKAELYAEAFGVRIARLNSLSENPMAYPRTRKFNGMALAASATPVNPGEETIGVTLNGVFEIE